MARYDPRKQLLNKMPKNSVCAEIGVDRGKLTQQILKIVHPQKLHLIDPWLAVTSEAYSQARYGTEVDQTQMDKRYLFVANLLQEYISRDVVHLHRATSQEAYSKFKDDYFDWIYIDGNHLYEFVKQDLNNYYPKVKTGGYITGDDYGSSGWWKDGVRQAVDEFIQAGKVKVVTIKRGQYILMKI
jgi:hypothetical protein